MNSLHHAKEIVRKLQTAGYTAYFAGGWVRDFIMGHRSSDIDIATDAPPQVILDLFPRTLLVGLSFGVVVVLINGHQFEVSTFRKDIGYSDGRKPDKIELSTPEEDASRRDFTINGLFFDPMTETIYDFVGGQEDIARGVIRTIGDPYERFYEDRLRMVRAFRFAARFGFQIDLKTQEAIKANAETLFPSVAKERIWQEFKKMAAYPRFENACLDMQRLGLLPVIFPGLKSLHFNDFKKLVAPFSLYPEQTPAILYLLGLFPNQSLDSLLDSARDLKVSGAELKLLEFAFRTFKFADQKSKDPVRWAYIYAHPSAKICLEMYAASKPEEERTEFLRFHEEHIDRLRAHIKRLQNKTPLVTASHLIELGVIPGRQMGHLLEAAEHLAISHNLESFEQTIEKLKASTFWPKL